MTNSRTWLGFGLLLGAAAAAGCSRADVRFVSYKDPYFPEPVHVDFGECVFRRDMGGDLHVIGRAIKETETGRLHHYLDVHVFWNPRPGRTFTESTATDATVTYVVASRQGSLRYTGTGFVFPRKRLGRMEFVVESGRLELEGRSGELTDIFGDTRLTGTLRAREDSAATRNLAREAQIVAYK